MLILPSEAAPPPLASPPPQLPPPPVPGTLKKRPNLGGSPRAVGVGVGEAWGEAPPSSTTVRENDVVRGTRKLAENRKVWLKLGKHFWSTCASQHLLFGTVRRLDSI